MVPRKSIIAGGCALLVIAGCVDRNPMTGSGPAQQEVKQVNESTGWEHPQVAGSVKKGYYPFNGNYEEIEYVLTDDSLAVFEGDILLDKELLRDNAQSGLAKEKAFMIADRNALWSGGVIPYAFSSDVPQAKRDLLLSAMQHWAIYTPIRFIPQRNGQKPYLLIGNGPYGAGRTNICAVNTIGCTGSISYMQVDGCSPTDPAWYIHELGHIVGLQHEQKRPDRDNYIKVTGTDGNYTKVTSGSQFRGSFDYNSIMLYNCYAGVEPLPGNSCWNNAFRLSEQDIFGVEMLYGNPSVSIVLDKNGDGYNDLVRIFANASSVSTYTGYYLQQSTGYRLYQLDTWLPWAGYGLEPISQFKKGDFDGDNKDDLIHLVSSAQYVNGWFGSITPGAYDPIQFNLWPGYIVGSGNNYLAGNFKVGDCNDNRTDLICIVPNQTYFNYFTWTIGRSMSLASKSVGFDVQDGTKYLVGDFDGKNGDDLIQFVSTTQVRIWLNKGTGAFDFFTFNPGYTMDLSNIAYYFRSFQGNRVMSGVGDNYADIVDLRTGKVWFGRSDMSSTKRFDVY